MLNALRVAVVVIALIVTGCGSQASPTDPAGTAQPSQPTEQTSQPTNHATGQPTTGATSTAEPSTTEPSTSGPPGSQVPLPTLAPEAPPEPLPEPELESADEIVEAMALPDLAPQVIVSMLDQLGIGLYQTDGTPIRVGAETSNRGPLPVRARGTRPHRHARRTRHRRWLDQLPRLPRGACRARVPGIGGGAGRRVCRIRTQPIPTNP